MENLILITELNDFIFCPVSIYFHKMYQEMDRMLFQSSDQINGTAAHEAVDNGHYSSKKDVLTGISIHSEKYGLVGKLDMFDMRTGTLRERKRTIKKIYDGYIFQLYAQCICLREMGYDVKSLELYSMTDNKVYKIKDPYKDLSMKAGLIKVIWDMRRFNIDNFVQRNRAKCEKCIYEPACDRSQK